MVDQSDIISDIVEQILEIYTCKVEAGVICKQFTQYGYNSKHKVNFRINVKYFYDTELHSEWRNTLEVNFQFTNRVPQGLRSVYKVTIPEVSSLTEESHFQLMTITEDMYLEYHVIDMLRTHMK